MTVSTAIDRLHAFEPRLRAAGIKALYVFGSVARGSANAESDIDLLFEADTSRHFSLLDQAKLQIELADVLGRPVDLFERDALRHRVRQQAEREILQVF